MAQNFEVGNIDEFDNFQHFVNFVPIFHLVNYLPLGDPAPPEKNYISQVPSTIFKAFCHSSEKI